MLFSMCTFALLSVHASTKDTAPRANDFAASPFVANDAGSQQGRYNTRKHLFPMTGSRVQEGSSGYLWIVLDWLGTSEGS